jgi:hypothetical protein
MRGARDREGVGDLELALGFMIDGRSTKYTVSLHEVALDIIDEIACGFQIVLNDSITHAHRCYTCFHDSLATLSATLILLGLDLANYFPTPYITRLGNYPIALLHLTNTKSNKISSYKSKRDRGVVVARQHGCVQFQGLHFF